MCKRRLWKWASLSIGDPFWNLEGDSFTGDSDRWRSLEKKLSLCMGAL
jgi:hypothetical protein